MRDVRFQLSVSALNYTNKDPPKLRSDGMDEAGSGAYLSQMWVGSGDLQM